MKKKNEVLGGVFGLIAAISMSGSDAASFSVNQVLDGADINPGDGICDAGGGDCTLRAAIMETNALAGADVISLPSGFYTLALGNTGENAAAEGDLDILDDLVITGADPATTTLNGNSYLYRIFSILKRADDTLPVVKISNVTMSQGIGDNYGALVFNEGDLVLDNVILTDANPSHYALLNVGSLNVNNSKIVNNSAGIFSSGGYAAIESSLFANNNGDQVGGSFTLSFGSASIYDTTFSDNVGYNLGGAIFVRAGYLTVKGSRFYRNTVTASSNTFSANGGALSIDGGALEISGSVFDGNKTTGVCSGYSGLGGAIILGERTDKAAIYDSTFTNNSSVCHGGAIVVQPGIEVVSLKRIILESNTSERDGGGIYVGGNAPSLAGSFVLSESSIINNTAAAAGGGLAFVISAYLSSNLGYQVRNTEISGNSAEYAGGVFSSGNGVTYQNLTIYGNSAAVDGGGFYQGDGRSDFNQVTVASNSSPSSTGGNLVNNGGILNINHTIVSAPIGGGVNCVGTITSLGYNVVSDDSCNLKVVGDQANTDPLLGQLSNNGGFSRTVALQAGSPAIDAGSPAYCDPANLVDQRYYYRGDGLCDVGAFESGSSIAQSGTLAFKSTTFTVNEGVGLASITLSRSNGSDGKVSLIVYDNGQGTATAGSDYSSVPRTTVEWNDGDSGDKTIEIAISDDSSIEDDETIKLQLESLAFVTGGADIGVSVAELRIYDNDAARTGTSSDEGTSGAFHPIFLLVFYLISLGIRRDRTTK